MARVTWSPPSEVYDLDDLTGPLESTIRPSGSKKGLENYNDEIEFPSDAELTELT